VRSIVHAVAFLRRERAAWPFAAVPIVVLALLFGVSAYVALAVVAPGVAARLPEGTSIVREILQVLLPIGAAVAAILVGFTAAVWLTPVLSAPALDELVALRLKDLGAPHLEPASFVTQIVCGFKAQALALLVGVPLVGMLWVTSLVVPPLMVVTLPLKVVVLSATVTWGLLDYPLSRRGIRLRQRMALLAQGKWAALGFGAVFAVLFTVPLLGIVFLPAGVVAATDLALRLSETRPLRS
jgi:uncharacterized protein involved in cysteine biosynthesis